MSERVLIPYCYVTTRGHPPLRTRQYGGRGLRKRFPRGVGGGGDLICVRCTYCTVLRSTLGRGIHHMEIGMVWGRGEGGGFEREMQKKRLALG